MFSCFSEFIADNEIFDIKKIKDIILLHLENLKNHFNTGFEKFPEKKLGWIRNPFSININEMNSELSLVMNEELIELSADENLRIKFNETTSDKFWISIKSEYPKLSKVAVSTLLPFATTYLCER
ncbi:unnamed protein product [Macrosiphum euphorbiae]|uniref:Zinc finger BED domain-containing protein 5 n=1 Tax=Macrosiphum euphorbiae TaxID=13131 RepID=A0AAV0W3D1_9HEMI|nr:unnamed protein product [Macrosiphum euphorbiae]